MPIYKVTVSVGDSHQTRLVEAHNEAQMLRHVVKQHIKHEPIRSPEQIKSMAGLAATGIRVETADGE